MQISFGITSLDRKTTLLVSLMLKKRIIKRNLIPYLSNCAIYYNKSLDYNDKNYLQNRKDNQYN